MMLLCITTASVVAFVGKKSSEQRANKTNNLLKQNIEALSQGDVTNGFVMKINPLYTKICYRNYVDKDRYITKQGYDDSTGEYYTYNEYYHSYKTYKRTQCDVIPIENALMWWTNCDTPQEAKCDAGNPEQKPVPYEYYE